jgi:hypothetical protein
VTILVTTISRSVNGTKSALKRRNNMSFGWCYAPVLSKRNFINESHKTQPILQRVKPPALPSAGWPWSAATVADNSVLDSGDDSGNDHYRSSRN